MKAARDGVTGSKRLQNFRTFHTISSPIDRGSRRASPRQKTLDVAHSASILATVNASSKSKKGKNRPRYWWHLVPSRQVGLHYFGSIKVFSRTSRRQFGHFAGCSKT
jgi:hypothetical protein